MSRRSRPTVPTSRPTRPRHPPAPPPTRRSICAALAMVLGLLAAAGAVVPDAPPAGAVAPRHQLADAVVPGSPPAGASPVVRYRSPTSSPVRVARPFVRPPQPWAAGHRGVDLSLGVGAPVLAPAAGTVTVAGTIVDRGVVTIEHADGRRSSLEPVTPTVAVGQRVAAGDLVGVVAAEPPHCAEPCVHWGVREGSEYLDPLTLLPGGGPIVLLPDDG